jgi:hypothetical protein
MKKQIDPSIKAHFLWSALTLVSLIAICAIPFALAQSRNRGTAKPNVIQPATPRIPLVTADAWEIAYELANGLHEVTSPFAFVFTVTNTNDVGPGSLRQAILDSNASPGPPGTINSIEFNISGSGVHTIIPATQLPDIVQPVMIDGYTQPGSSPNTNPLGQRDNAVILIELSGEIAPPSSAGLTILANQCGARGLVINRFQGDAIVIGSSSFPANDCVIEGNFIGTNTAGTAALPNGASGIALVLGHNTRIGGITPAARNLISGNAGDGVAITSPTNTVQGNFVGTDVTGTVAIGNRGAGVSSIGGNLIGGNTAAARNIISGNNDGIDVAGDVVQGNFIGTDLTGTIAVRNLNAGVNSGGAIIGGLTSTPGTAPGNVISGNGIAGLLIFGATLVTGNTIGADITGTHPLGNGLGISIVDVAGSTVGGMEGGAGNIIAFNGTSCEAEHAGVIVSGSGATRNAILGNSIFSNAGLGIDLVIVFDGPCGITANDNCDADLGPNNLQNYPVLTFATSGGGRTAIQGSLNSTPNGTFSIEFFDNHQCHPSGNGSGEIFIGSTNVTTDANCTAPIAVIFPVNVQPGHVITATATDSGGNTSEFSRCVSVGSGIPTPTPTGSPSATPTGTPVATGTPSPTPTATASPTPTGTPASVATNPATNVASFLATLNGTVNPHGSVTTVYFQYGTTTSYGFATSIQTKSGNTNQNVSANISGLTANTTYHFRIVAANSGGTTRGADRTFTTLSATGPPVVITNSASSIASFSATLNGSVDPHGLSTNVHFEYGTTTNYGSTTTSQNKTGNTYQSVSASINGLTANTIYHFRVVATNSAGTTHGTDRTFTTLTATGPAVVMTNPASLIASFSATLNGTVNPHGLSTNVHFEYGTTSSYGSATASQTKTGNTYQSVSANISGLLANTTYHFRIVATNSAGTTHGSDMTFTTLTATGPPVVTTNPATNVTSSSATLNATVNPHGLSTTIHFEYGRTTSYGSMTASQTKTGNTYQTVSANISGLTANTIYHFRVVATNSSGTTVGSDRTFRTP